MARFDPRGSRNHALVVTVPRYHSDRPPDPSGALGDIAAVRHNATGLARALRAGGVFGPDEVTLAEPDGADAFYRELTRACARAEGLLLLYFAGHGLVSSYHDPDELWLAMPGTTIVPGGPPVVLRAVRWTELLPAALAHARAEQLVVVLDCCHAGNASAAWNKLPAADRRRVSLLACVEANDRIDAGDAATPTPFTARLVQLLETGVTGRGGEVGFADLADALTAYMSAHHTTLRRPPTPWLPHSCPAEAADVLLAGLGTPPAGPDGGAGQDGDGTEPGPSPDGGGAVPGEPDTGPAAPGGREYAPGTAGPVGGNGARGEPGAGRSGRRRSAGGAAALGLVLGLLGLLGALGYPALRALWASEEPASCPPPLELRVLTDPDAAPTVRRAAAAYLNSDADRDHGCRGSGITVYSARATAVITAFREQARFWQSPDATTNPQRDVGPQPDVWIPGSVASVAWAGPGTADGDADADADGGGKGGGAPVTLTAGEPFVHSPLVLAVPGRLAPADQGERSGRSLAQLLAAHPLTVARADPEHTDAALLATVGLYGGLPGAAPGAERALWSGGPTPPDGRALLCALPRDPAADRSTAALVPEHLLRTGTRCEARTREPRVAEYPSDVPRLALPFVRVAWAGATRDAPARRAAVERFRQWLTGPAGVAVFTADGYRPGSGEGPGAGSGTTAPPAEGTLADPGPLPDQAPVAAVAAALEGYRKARGPGRVLFLLDNSGSMQPLWDGPSGAPGIVRQAFDDLGGEDAYGVWTVSAAPGAERAYTPLLALAAHARRAEAEAALARARVADLEADPYAALRSALDAMRPRNAGDDSPRLIVYVTDDEDHDRLTGARLTELLGALRAAAVPVVMASLDIGACAAGKADARIAEASGGRCVDGSEDLAAGVRAEVARTGTGDPGEEP
ncbi:substrate-binding domain-containing protein [Streptomyces pyxinae]|uniref:substrate-binding domain-containing protein n=1 Tax=Streptomyces pyxinae TaxID=2970734 RepID=UPI002867C787|nr:substrate-binding domain-containing protein [Streptomyces sp. LP05-1]